MNQITYTVEGLLVIEALYAGDLSDKEVRSYILTQMPGNFDRELLLKEVQHRMDC